MIWRDHAPMVPTSAAATRRDPGQPDTGLLAATDARSGTVRGEGVKEGTSRNKIECFLEGTIIAPDSPRIRFDILIL